jgi:hypothetical protein
MGNDIDSRIDAEWLAVSAFRELLKLSTKGDAEASTYRNALEFGGALIPRLLGEDASILRRARDSDITLEYKQRAILKSAKSDAIVDPLSLVLAEIEEVESFIAAGAQVNSKFNARQLESRLRRLYIAKSELETSPHSENQLIFRDAYSVERGTPRMSSGKGYRDFKLPDENILRMRVLHPDKPEHVTGADLIYERHSPQDQSASVVIVQYKVWEKRCLPLNDARMNEQFSRMRKFACDGGLCNEVNSRNSYRFPYCAVFIRPTDRLQRPDQKMVSSGEHLPLCRIEDCATKSVRGGLVLDYRNIRNVSISSDVFEYLVNAGRIGSRSMTYDELECMYAAINIDARSENMVIHA